MERLLVMILATVFDVFIIIGIAKSGKYAAVLQAESGIMGNFLGIGCFLLDSKICFFKEKWMQSLKKKTKLIHGEKYAEYYAYIAMAKVLTIICLSIGILGSIGVLLGGTGALFMLIVAVMISAIAWNFCILTLSDEMKQRTEICMQEFPDMVIKFALLINSGMVLREAWFLVSKTKDNIMYRLMLEACDDMNNGQSDADAIYAFGVKSNCPEIRKFTASMVQGIHKGNSELATFLEEQAQELMELKRQQLLQKGEKAAGKLLLPIGLTFIGVILIIGVGAMQAMSF